MTAEQLLDDAVAHTGWDEDLQISVLLDYIENQSSPEAFADFLEERVNQEDEYGKNDDD